MGFLDRFLKKKEAQITPVNREPIRVGPNYFVSGEKVIFDLNGLDYSFEKFYLQVMEKSDAADEGLFINVPEEAPMNLINIAAAAREEEGVELNREEILGANTAKLTLKLADELYEAVKDKVFACTDPIDVFDIEHEGKKLLRNLSHYAIVGWGCTTTRDL